jgi:hypothetical protein
MVDATALPWSRPRTAADLEAMPDDGHRYELLDGTLLVTPAPRFEHQLAAGRLHALLVVAAPADLVVLMEPLGEHPAGGPVARAGPLPASWRPSYWVVDPDEPSVVAWELREDACVEVARASGDERFAMEHPIRLSFRPADLIV